MENIIKSFKTTRIVDAIKKYGSYGKLYIPKSVSNDWDAWLKGLYLSDKGKLYVIVYVQGDNTDEDTFVSATEFFNKGKYSGSTDIHHFRFTFGEEEKKKFAEVIVKHIMDLESGLGDMKKTIERLTNWKLINPVSDHFYDKYRMKYFSSWYKSDSQLTIEKSFYHAKGALDKIIRSKWEEFSKLTDDELVKKYIDIFGKEFDDFRKDFNPAEYRKEHYL